MHLHHRNSSCAANRRALSACNSLTPLGIVVAVLLLATAAAGGRAPAKVDVNKCCRLGEQLDEGQQCVAGDSDHWWPLVFLINKKTYFEPHGDAPRFFHTLERKMPACEAPELISSPVSVFSNGSLFLSERGAIVEADHFCVDREVALVCLQRPQGADSLRAPIKLTKIYKCCGARSAYNTEAGACVPVEEGHAALSAKLIHNSSSIDYLFGFPPCTGTSHYAIADRFDEEQLSLDSGSLTLRSVQRLEWNEFCLEYTETGRGEPFVNVFTCSDQLVSADQQPAPKVSPTFALFNRFQMTNSYAPHPQKQRLILYSIGLSISVIFLTATIATGFLLPSNHHVLHWRCQTFYVACLLFGDLLLAINQIYGAEIRGFACSSIGKSTHAIVFIPLAALPLHASLSAAARSAPTLCSFSLFSAAQNINWL